MKIWKYEKIKPCVTIELLFKVWNDDALKKPLLPENF